VFTLHERLESDTVMIGRLELSLLLLMNDRSIPWFILVPERIGLSEIDEMLVSDRRLLIEEVAFVSSMIRSVFNPAKINVGALGNLVPQLHIHVIGRFVSDRAWPGLIWGTGPVQPYDGQELKIIIERIKNASAGRIKRT